MSEARNPEISSASARDLALAERVAELAERIERGEAVDLDALAEADPEQAAELGRILPTIRRMMSAGKSVALATGWERPDGRQELGTLGDFRLLREVGRGGMGIVYEAEQLSLHRRVALKILPLAAALDPRHHQRFLLEARAAACLHHTNIVPVHAVGSERGVPYYAMQFIDGCTLAQVLEQLRGHAREAATVLVSEEAPSEVRRARADDALVLERAPDLASSMGTSSRDRNYIRAVADHGRRAAEALDHAHSRGVLHRDIKPANLMLDADGHLWVTDFGLAQIQGDSRLTLTGDVVGTLRYMSPEQALARRVVIDGRTDIYSLGATLYELLALSPVFDGSDRAEILRKIAQDDPTPLRKLNPAVPQDLETIVRKTLAKEPADRYATARELADDLGRFLDARPITARPPSTLERLTKWVRRNRAVVAPASAFIVVSCVAVVGGLVWSNLWLNHHNERLRIERDRAEQLSKLLKVQRDLAEDHRRVADHHLYAFRLHQAAEALRARRFTKAQEVLRDCRPEPGKDDLREFAWHSLWTESRRDLAVLSEESESVTSAAVSPDGHALATGDRDGTIRIRDPESGEVSATLRGHALPVEHMAFSRDGHRLVSCGVQFSASGHQAEALVWDLDSERLLARLDGLVNIEKVQWSRDSDQIWMLDSPGSRWRLGRWDVKSDPARPRLAWSRFLESARTPRPGDGPIAALQGPGGGLYLQDLMEASRLGWTGAIDSLHGQAVAASPNGHLVAVGAGPWNVVWDVAANREQARFRNEPLQGMIMIGFSPDSRFLTIEYNFIDRCEIHDLSRGTSQTTPRGDADSTPNRIHAYSSDSQLFARNSPKPRFEGPTKVWRLDPWQEIADSSEVLVGSSWLHFARENRSLIVLNGSAVFRWNFLPPPPTSHPEGHTDEAWAAAFSSDGHLLVTGSDDTDDRQTLRVWDPSTGRLSRGWKPHQAMTSAVAFQPGSTVVASAGLAPEANLRLWDATTGALIARLDGHADRVRTLAFRPDGQRLASAGSDRTIRVWDVAARRCLQSWTAHTDTIRQVAFSPNGQWLASASNDATVRLWSATTGALLMSWTGGAKVAAVTFSPDGGVVCWAQEDGIIQRRDLARARALAPLHCEYDELRCLAFSPDGHTLAAAGKSGKIHLWDPVCGQELLTLEGPPCQTNALAFSPDGSSLAACWHDGSVRLFRAH